MTKYPGERLESRRTSARYTCRLDVEVSCNGREEQCETYDVALSGAYVVTASPPPVNQIVRVVVHSPDVKRPVEWMGRVVRVIEPDGGVGIPPPGMALAIFGMDDANRTRWLDLLAGAARQSGDYPAVPATYHPTGEHAAVGSGATHHEVPLDLAVRDVRGLLHLVGRNLTSGGAFVPTGEHVAVGAWVDVRLRHPITAETFTVTARVARAEKTGVAVEFAEMAPEHRKRLQRFIVTGRTE